MHTAQSERTYAKRTVGGLSAGLVTLSLAGLAVTIWTQMSPARAQNEKPVAQAVPAGNGMASAISASGDFVYVLKGNTVVQLKSSDLSVAAQKDLGAPPPPLKQENTTTN
jgi:hypothetical protein